MAGYDVFMSLGGPDRERGEGIVQELVELGMRVFLDQKDIPHFAGLTHEILRALSASKVLVAYYSKTYPERHSCQVELTAAFLAGQARGNPIDRILVINPEEDNDHVLPAQLSDARYLVAGQRISTIARLIRDKVRGLRGAIGPVRADHRSSPHFGRIPGVHNFVGRYRELWALHSALHAPELRLSQERIHGPVALVAGGSGVGKSSLVAAYATHFAAAYPGGVYWTTLGGGGPDVLKRYENALAKVAGLIGLPAEDRTGDRVRSALSRHLTARPGAALWIVDQVPAGADAAMVHDLVLPGCPELRTVLIGDWEADEADAADVEAAPAIRLEGLTRIEGGLLLDGYLRPRDERERRARDWLVDLLDGHAGALTALGRMLRDGPDRFRYEERLVHLSLELTALAAARNVRGLFNYLAREGRFQHLLLRACGDRPAGVVATTRVAFRSLSAMLLLGKR